MNSISFIVARDDANAAQFNTLQTTLLVALLTLFVLAVVLVGSLFFLRRVRRARKDAEAQLPLYEKRQSNHRRLTIQATRESVVVYHEKGNSSSNSPPTSPVPEIRITFPDEVDDAGKRQSGRVVVVRVGEHSVGLEPLDEDLPPYERDGDRFDSLDLDRIGGLKEKDDKYYS
jgi:cbb3-type cytochrome oxidase subunit 3